MKLYKEKAKELIGKKIDCKVRRFGYYPMEIKEIDGELYLKDTNGVCMKIPEKEDDFNCHVYDFVVD